METLRRGGESRLMGWEPAAARNRGVGWIMAGIWVVLESPGYLRLFSDPFVDSQNYTC